MWVRASTAGANALLQQVELPFFRRESGGGSVVEQHRLASALDVHSGVVVAVQVGGASGVGTTAQPSNRSARRIASRLVMVVTGECLATNLTV